MIIVLLMASLKMENFMDLLDLLGTNPNIGKEDTILEHTIKERNKVNFAITGKIHHL